MHHLRHSFACRRHLAWYREGKDVNALLPALATYLGHVKVTSTAAQQKRAAPEQKDHQHCQTDRRLDWNLNSRRRE